MLRKQLLYQTKVEYSQWALNHVIGCKHGCKFPCYAFLMAKRFGWVKDYKDWINPKVVENTLELLGKEIPKYRNKINSVHLCFMTDPFMYDFERENLIPEVKDLTLKIIELLNKESIKVTTLTKGFYPEEILDTGRFSLDNEYGITLVSLNPEFKKKFEPFSAPYELRLDSLKKLHEHGLKTWISIEPYPTPFLDPTAEDIEQLLERVSFVDRIVFGRLNYNGLAKDSDDFYKSMVQKVIEFCKIHKINYHIKEGTPNTMG